MNAKTVKVCGDNCAYLIHYGEAGPLCTAWECSLTRVTSNGSDNAIRCPECITNRTKEKEE